MILKDLIKIIEDDEKIINFLLEKQLIPQTRRCSKCNLRMEITKDKNRALGHIYRCGRPCRSTKSLLSNTFFENSKLKIGDLLLFIYSWSHEKCSFKFSNHETSISSHPFVAWRKYLRDICTEILISSEQMIGGPGKTVQIDESQFSRRKNHSGRILPNQWVFGGIESDTNNAFMEPVLDRSRETLFEIIRRRIRPETIIISDCWAAYETLENMGYEHLTVNHSFHFVDPETGAHTQKVENMWFLAKRRNKQEGGTKRSELTSYFSEFL